MDDKLKCSRKRPEMVYYRPGMMSKLNKKLEEFAENHLLENYLEGKHDLFTNNDAVREASEERKSMRVKHNKKPDKQVYVPKARSIDDRKMEEKSKPKHYHRERNEAIPNIIFENSRFNRNEEQRRGGHKHHSNSRKAKSSHQLDKQTLCEEGSWKNDKAGSTKEESSSNAVLFSDALEKIEKPVKSEKTEESEQILEPEKSRESDFQASSVKPKTFKPNFQSGKSKKYSNRSDYKFEQNLPPRLQKKLQMEKACQSKAHSFAEQSVQLQQTNPNINRGGIIRLPPNTAATLSGLVSSPLPKSPIYQRPVDNYSESSDALRSRQYGILTPRQLFNPYQSNKPCVVIRPTYQTVISHPNSRSNMNVQTIQVSSPSADISTFTHLSHPYTHNHEHSHSSPNASLPMNFQLPSNSSQCIGNAEVPISNAALGSFEGSNMIRKRLKPVVEKNMREVLGFEKELQAMLSRDQVVDERALNQIRWKIQLRYEHIILTDLKFCAECNIEQMLWKSVFYQFIEMHRRNMEENSQEDSKDMLNKLVEEATTFFENLLVNLQDKFEFNVDQYIEHEYDPELPGYDAIKLAAISAQKIYLYLGDLARYKEQASGTSNFGRARSCYLKAQQLAPKNGRPYNQLALLAMYGRRKLDAVYYYMRSLAASNPFQSARENLLGIFDEVRKKYENSEKKRIEEKLSRLKMSESIPADYSMSSISQERLEIWIRPDGTSSKHTSLLENVSAEEEFDMLTDVDLNKRFVLSFLHVHGKLFTKVGMESFVSAVKQMLLELRCLLKRKPFPITSQRLLQLMAISMFSVHHTSLKQPSEHYNSNCRTVLQEHAIQVTLATVSLLIERANASLQEHLSSRHCQVNLVSEDVAELLPAIKIWTDWMSCQKQLWSPPPNSDFGCKDDIWTLFADALTTLGNVNIRSVKLLPTKFDGCEPIVLPEDTTLSGFIPLLGAPQCSSFVQPPYDKEKARTCLRISRIQFFGDYLCGIPEPYLEFDVGKKRFYSLVPISSAEECENSQTHNCDTSDNETDDIPTDSSSIENVNSIHEEKSTEDQEIEELWSRQEELKKAQKREEKVRQHLNAVLRKEKRTRMVIQPRFLIPDTNCFIDHLVKLQSLLQCGFYEIIIPLVVINELNGLTSRASGVNSAKPFSVLISEALSSDSEHHKRVAQMAKKALDFLEVAFLQKNSRLKAITSKGSILDNINFTNESLQMKDVTNDDLVLSCCLQFIKERPSERNLQESGEIINIFRETVLLTEDRNLRVKALSQNVPVKSLPVFLQWANIP